MYCTGCGAKLAEGAKFCVNCGLPVGGSAAASAAPSVPAGQVLPDASADPGQTTRFQAVAGGVPADDSMGAAPVPAPGEKQTLKQFLMKRHNIGGRSVPMLTIILAALIATATIATAAFLIYRSVAAGQVQEQQVQEAPVKKKKKVVHKQQEAEEESEDEDTPAKRRARKKERKAEAPEPEESEPQEQEQEQQAQQEAEVEEPEDASSGSEVTAPVANTYDPTSETGAWTGALQQYGYNGGAQKTGSYKEGSAGCGVCYGAQNRPLKLNITSVDANARTASGTVSFLMHGHNGPMDVDEDSDSGDAYIENVPFNSISIDGWRTGGAINLYTGHGKTVQMTLRLKYGSSDDYSVWIRTVPTQFNAGKFNLTYTWGQTDMYTITKN